MFGQLLWETKRWVALVGALLVEDSSPVEDPDLPRLADLSRASIDELLDELLFEVLPRDTTQVVDLEGSEHIALHVSLLALELESAGFLSLAARGYELAAGFSTEDEVQLIHLMHAALNSFAIGARRNAEGMLLRYAPIRERFESGRIAWDAVLAHGWGLDGEFAHAHHVLGELREAPDLPVSFRALILQLSASLAYRSGQWKEALRLSEQREWLLRTGTQKTAPVPPIARAALRSLSGDARPGNVAAWQPRPHLADRELSWLAKAEHLCVTLAEQGEDALADAYEECILDGDDNWSAAHEASVASALFAQIGWSESARAASREARLRFYHAGVLPGSLQAYLLGAQSLVSSWVWVADRPSSSRAL